MILRLMTD